jgi:hypothetical protein
MTSQVRFRKISPDLQRLENERTSLSTVGFVTVSRIDAVTSDPAMNMHELQLIYMKAMSVDSVKSGLNSDSKLPEAEDYYEVTLMKLVWKTYDRP